MNEILCLTPEFVEKYHDAIVCRYNAFNYLTQALRDIANAPDADCFDQMKSIADAALKKVFA